MMSSGTSQWNKAKPWVLQGGLFVVIGLLLWFGVGSLHRMIAERRDTIQQLDVMRSYRTAEIQKLPELEKQNTLIHAYQKDLQIVLSKEELVSFIQSLEDLAKLEGVELEIESRDNTLLESKITKPVTIKDKAGTTSDAAAPVTAEKRKPKNGEEILEKLPLKQYIRLTLIVRGSYTSLVSYLNKLETMPYALEVLSLMIKESDKENDNGVAFSGDFVQPGVAPEGVVLSPEPSKLVLSGEFDLVVYTRE